MRTYRPRRLEAVLLCAIVVVTYGGQAIASSGVTSATGDDLFKETVQRLVVRFLRSLMDVNGPIALEKIKDRFPASEEAMATLGKQIDQLQTSLGKVEKWECVGWMEPLREGYIGRVVFLTFHKRGAALWEIEAYSLEKAPQITKIKFTTDDVLERLRALSMTKIGQPVD